MSQNIQTIIVNFGDDATGWFREIADASRENPAEIHIQFVGGCSPPPYETISLRNLLLQIPPHIKVVTIASCSLPPLTCAAWLVGDERRIARDAVIWIPNIPEPLTRCIPRGPSALREVSEDAHEESEPEVHEEDSPEDSAHVPGPANSPAECSLIMGHTRIIRDLSLLCEAINEWFPTGEFIGSSLNVQDLLEWRVIQPEWVFGGRSPRTRRAFSAETPPAVPEPSQKSGYAKNENISLPKEEAKPSLPAKPTGSQISLTGDEH